MNLRFSTPITALGCVLLASCYPYDESQNKKQAQKPQQKTPTAAEQQKTKAQRESLKEKQNLAKKDTVKETGNESTADATTTPADTPKPPTEEKRTDYEVANPVPGKPGYVFSPYNNKLVDVRDIPSGTLVQDPTYTGAGKGYFRVP